MIFKKLHNAPLFWLITYDFFSKYNRKGVFNQSEIGNEYTANFQNKMYISDIIEVEKKFRIGEVKIDKIK